MSHAPYTNYQSPLSARTTLAAIDTGLIVQVIDQLSGAELERVEMAVRERRHKLTTGDRRLWEAQELLG